MKFLRPGRLLVAGLVLFAVAVALLIIPSSDYIFLPDRAHPVAPLVTVKGGHEPTRCFYWLHHDDKQPSQGGTWHTNTAQYCQKYNVDY